MGYQPIYDGEFDLAITSQNGQEMAGLLESVTRHKLFLVNWTTIGPAGGNPVVKLRGTRRQLLGWLNDYYDTSWLDFKRDDTSDAQTWINATEVFNIAFVA